MMKMSRFTGIILSGICLANAFQAVAMDVYPAYKSPDSVWRAEKWQSIKGKVSSTWKEARNFVQQHKKNLISGAAGVTLLLIAAALAAFGGIDRQNAKQKAIMIQTIKDVYNKFGIQIQDNNQGKRLMAYGLALLALKVNPDAVRTWRDMNDWILNWAKNTSGEEGLRLALEDYHIENLPQALFAITSKGLELRSIE